MTAYSHDIFNSPEYGTEIYPTLIDDSTILLGVDDESDPWVEIWTRSEHTWTFISNLTPPYNATLDPPGPDPLQGPIVVDKNSFYIIEEEHIYASRVAITTKYNNIAIYENSGSGVFVLTCFINRGLVELDSAISSISLSGSNVLIWTKPPPYVNYVVQIYTIGSLELPESIEFLASAYHHDNVGCMAASGDTLVVGARDVNSPYRSCLLIYKNTDQGWAQTKVIDLEYTIDYGSAVEEGVPKVDCISGKIVAIACNKRTGSRAQSYCDILIPDPNPDHPLNWIFEQQHIYIINFIAYHDDPEVKISRDGTRILFFGWDLGGGGYAGTMDYIDGKWQETGDMSIEYQYDWPCSLSPSGNYCAVSSFCLTGDM